MPQRSRIRALGGLLAAAVGGTVLALGLAAPAGAHAALVSTDPEDGASIDEAPASVSATFSEPLDGPSTEIAVTGPDGALDLADPTFDGDTFSQPMLYTTPGEYTVAFRVISEDGHRVDDSLKFTVAEIPADLYAEGAAPEDSAESSEAASEEATEPATSEATTAAADDEESNTGTALAAILLGLLIIVGGGVLLVKLLGRKPKTGDDAKPTDES
ncbi:copper resistance CopC family protein [Glycomyces buryatensis]|nr:copper resistance CopC family protein [Glycomyces buryatensis]